MGNKNSSMLQDEEIKSISEETGFSAAQIERLYTRFKSLDVTESGSLSRSDFLRVPELAINPLSDRIVQMFFADCDPSDEDERINFKQFARTLATFRPSSSSQHNSQHSNNNNNNNSHSNNNNSSSYSELQLQPNENNHAEEPNQLRMPRIGSSYNGLSSKHHLHYHHHHHHNNHHHHHHRHNSSKDIPSLLKSHSFLDRNHIDGNFKPIHSTNSFQSNELTSKAEFVFRLYDVDDDERISFDDLRCILKMMVGSYIEDVQLNKIASRAFHEMDKNNDGYIDYEEFCKVFSCKDLDDKLRVKFF